MPSLLLFVFVLQLIIHLINTFGATAINEVLWSIYNRLPISSTSRTVKEQKELQGEFLKVRKELNATSSQDEFAKWAKLRRQHDKLLEELEKKKMLLTTTKATFTSTTSTIRYLSTNGLRFLIQFWYTKQAMFYLPSGWIPYYGEWLLSFPRAPIGSISIQAWCLACGAVILLVSDAVVAGLGLVASAEGEKKKPMKFAEMEGTTMGEKNGEKKQDL